MTTAAMYNTPFQSFMDFIKFVSVAIIITVIIRVFIIEPYYIPSGSMLTTLQKGDRIFVSRFSYGIHIPFVSKELVNLGDVNIGDVIVFPFPNDPRVTYIKRVVGKGGDTIEVRNKQLYRNGAPVQEAYIRHSSGQILNDKRDNFGPVTVPEGKLFVMGDNRDESEDSRYWLYVDKDTVYGKAVLIFWSSNDWVDVEWSRIGTLIK